MNRSTYDDLIGQLYETLAIGGNWADMLELLSDQLDARFAIVAAVDPQSRRLLMARTNRRTGPKLIIDYLRHWHARNPRAPQMMALAPGQFMQCHDIFDDAFVAADPYYQRFLIPNGGRYTTAIRVDVDIDQFVLIIVTTSSQVGPLSGASLVLLERFCFHLARAMQIHRLAFLSDGKWEVGRQLLAQQRHPTLVVDAAGSVVFRNLAAGALLSRGDVFVERDGALTVRRPDDERRFRSLMAQVFDDGASPTDTRVLSLRPDDRPIQLPVFINLLQPQAPLLAFGDTPLAMLVVHEADESSGPDPESVAVAFELTPTEARIAASLARGRTAEQIAVDHQVSLTTVRSQIKSLFAKTGARRQVDLIRIISTMPDLTMLRTGT